MTEHNERIYCFIFNISIFIYFYISIFYYRENSMCNWAFNVSLILLSQFGLCHFSNYFSKQDTNKLESRTG